MQHAQVRRHHVPGGKRHDVAGQQVGHVDFFPAVFPADDRDRRLDHRPQLLRLAPGAEFLKKAEPAADEHQNQNHHHGGKVPVPGGLKHVRHKRDERDGQQNPRKGVQKRVEKLQIPGPRLLMGNLVARVLFGELLHIHNIQALFPCLQAGKQDVPLHCGEFGEPLRYLFHRGGIGNRLLPAKDHFSTSFLQEKSRGVFRFPTGEKRRGLPAYRFSSAGKRRPHGRPHTRQADWGA